MGLFNFISKSKFITPQERRAKNNARIKSMGIACNENLPMIESSSDVKLKDIDTIARRAIASLLIIQVACDVNNGNYEESKEVMPEWLYKFGVMGNLLPKEMALLQGDFSQQDVIDVSWTYEAYWSLVWALGLINDIDEPFGICDCNLAIELVTRCRSLQDFKKSCKIRNVEEILNMLDLYYRYHWACVEKQINPETEIGYLDPGVVVERRRGLEWLFSEEDDWNNISLDT